MFELSPLPKCEDSSLLQELSVHCLVDDTEIERWNEGVIQSHYLKNATLVGEPLRYVVKFREHWVALFGWPAPAWHLKAREAWVGWTNLQRRARLQRVAQNSRFVILADRGAWPNLASRALALVCQQLSEDGQRVYGYPIAAMESFVDSQLFREATGSDLPQDDIFHVEPPRTSSHCIA